MASHAETTVPATRRSRKSVSGHGKDNATVNIASALSPAKSRVKSRSKSMGPGGLDALKPTTGNRRVSLAAPSRPPPRSILKPTMPLAEIPPHKSKANDERRTGQENEDLTIKADELNASGTKVALRTEEEQQAAAREREDRERAELAKQAASEREARRKSLANRRVSFAAEATLHTFHEIEYMQDSTTSTDSTRRASSLAAQSPAPPPEQALASDPSEPPSTPPEQVEERVPESPANQRGLHQKRRRRSSGAAALTLNSVNVEKAQGSAYGSDSDSGDEVVEVQTEEVSDSSQDSDEEDGTMMTLDEMTSASVASGASARSGSSRDSTSDLDEKLRLAAERARSGQNDTTQNIAAEDDDDDGEIIPTFAGWIKKPVAQTDNDGTENRPLPQAQLAEAGDETGEIEMEMDMTDNTGGIIPSVASSPFKEHDDEDMSMEVTSALGGILSKAGLQSRRQAVPGSPERTAQDDSIAEDQTMDLTMAVGGINASRESAVSDIEGNEDMSMELTTAVGGLLSAAASKAWAPSGRRRSMAPKQKQAGEKDEGDVTIGMDMTMPIGGIIQPSSPARRQAAATASAAKQRTPVSSRSPARKSPSKAPKDVDITRTPDFAAFHGKGLRRSPPAGDTAVSVVPNTTLVETPTKNPPAMMIGDRSNTPKRPASASKTAQPASPSKAVKKSPGLFARNPSTGATTPKVVLTPQRRRLSGVGADRSGLGSPKVAAILDRRTSLGDAAAEFVPGQDASNVRRKVAFEDPRTLELEIDRERQDEEGKENGRKVLEREADGDAALTLKEMISGLSPKKSIGKGRKSLHVGSAKGLLGKRPAELDDDDEEEEPRDGVKRLKNHQGSPVKNVRLQAPPSKAETTGRMTRAGRKKLGTAEDDITTPTITLTMSGDGAAPTTPKDHGRFRDEDDHPTATIDFSRSSSGKTDGALPDIDENGEPRIHLQDFLNMTNIRFLELTTTKRRHTVAPGEGAVGLAEDDADEASLERCVIAGACTVPMLELYQHSCRELKKYISEGRRIVKEIETEAFEENPPLFKEYLSASPEFKNLMDNQFKNVKAHARLLSKAMWYEWRMKLQNGLKEGLVKMLDDMALDEESIEKQKKLLDPVLPRLIERFESLEQECGNLELAAQELADCDPADLEAARADLVEVGQDIEAKKAKIAELERQLQGTESTLGGLKEQKQNSLEAIAASEKIREECRGWTASEVTAMRDRAEAIEKQHGWAVTGISGTTMSLSYHREVELVFDAASFQTSDRRTQGSNARIDLWYIGANREKSPSPLTAEKEYMLNCIRDNLRALPQSQTKVSALLRAVATSWDKTRALARQVKLIQTTFRTETLRTSDSSVAVRVPMLLPQLESKVELAISLTCRATGIEGDGVQIGITPRAAVVYGETFNAQKMGEFLATRIESTLKADQAESDGGLWVDALLELQTKLLARGKKATMG